MELCLFDAAVAMKDIPFYLCTGTALGMIREGGFIEHDYDVDIAVMEDVDIPSVITAFERSGKFRPYAFRKFADKVYVELSFHHLETQIQLDVFVTFTLPNGDSFNFLWDLKGPNGGNPLLLYYTRFKLVDVVYKGLEFKCGDESYVAQTYGDDWRVPKNFSKLADDNCQAYLATLDKKWRPNLKSVEASRAILVQKFSA
jgi:hypothetical protein